MPTAKDMIRLNAPLDKDLPYPLSKRIAKTYNFDPLKPHFYTVKLGFTGVYIIYVVSAQKHRLWVLVSTNNLCSEQK